VFDPQSAADSDFKNYLSKAGYNVNEVEKEFDRSTLNTLNTNDAVYYLHGDHLGTATFVTNEDGEATQFFLNLPFGETMVEQQDPTSYANPYKFNAKELDSETGLYYYGARYYNPRISIWYGVDPLAVYNPVMESQFYGDGQHNGGVYNWGNLNPYIYTYQNPIRYIDPNGKQVDAVKKFERQAHNAKSFETNNFRINPKTQTWYFDHTANARNKTAKFFKGLVGAKSDPQNTVMAGPVLEKVKNANSVKIAQVELAKLLGKDGKIDNGETQGYFYDIGTIGGKEFWKIAVNSAGDFFSGKFIDDNTFFKEENVLGSFWSTARVSDDGQNIIMSVFDTKTVGSATDGLLERDKGSTKSKFHLYMWNVSTKEFFIQAFKNNKTK